MASREDLENGARMDLLAALSEYLEIGRRIQTDPLLKEKFGIEHTTELWKLSVYRLQMLLVFFESGEFDSKDN